MPKRKHCNYKGKLFKLSPTQFSTQNLREFISKNKLSESRSYANEKRAKMFVESQWSFAICSCFQAGDLESLQYPWSIGDFINEIITGQAKFRFRLSERYPINNRY